MERYFLIDGLVMFVKNRKNKWFVVYRCLDVYYVTTLENYRADKVNTKDVFRMDSFNSFDEIADFIQICF